MNVCEICGSPNITYSISATAPANPPRGVALQLDWCGPEDIYATECDGCGERYDGDCSIVYDYDAALRRAESYLEMTELEPTSAIRQAGSDLGIPFGDHMGHFVDWAYDEMFSDSK